MGKQLTDDDDEDEKREKKKMPKRCDINKLGKKFATCVI